MSEYQIVVCGSVVPDPLQTLEPVSGPAGPALKNEMMLPAWLDPWAGHALFEAANLAAKNPGSKVWLVALGPKAKLQQTMMTLAQKAPFELIALDGSASGFTDATGTATALAEAIQAIPGLDRSRLLVFGGWESASRGAGATMQIVGELLGITDQFQGVDEIGIAADGSLKVEGGSVDLNQLREKLAAVSKQFKNQPVRIRGDGNVNYQRIVEVIDTCQKAGIWNISFATQRPETSK